MISIKISTIAGELSHTDITLIICIVVPEYGTIEADTKEEIETRRSKLVSCVPVSPFPIYAIFTVYFFILILNVLAVADLIYDKVCFKHYRNLSLCNNATFTRAHPELQVPL